MFPNRECVCVCVNQTYITYFKKKTLTTHTYIFLKYNYDENHVPSN